MRPVIVPWRFQNLALALETVSAAYFSYELFRIYRGTHPVLSHKLAEHGIWPPPQPPAARDGAKGEDVWLSINGVPVPASIGALNFWKKG